MANSIIDLQTTQELNSSDLFVLAQQDEYIARKFNSCAVDGNTLVDVLMQKVLDIQQLKDTAYATSCEFSLYDHKHDDLYNNLSVKFTYASERTYHKLSSYFSFENVEDDDQMLSIGNMFIDGTLVPIEIPLSAVSNAKKIVFQAAEPLVGSLKFVALSTIGSNNDIRYKSENFDGWLYPDGSSFQLSDFALSTTLKKLYGNIDQTTFTLPDLRHFLKFNSFNTKVDGSAIAVVPGKNSLKRHTHSVNAVCDAEVFVVIRLPTNDTAASGGTIHRGNGKLVLSDNIQHPMIKYSKTSNSKCGLAEFIDKLKSRGILMFGSDAGKIENPNYKLSTKFTDIRKILEQIDIYNKTKFLDYFDTNNMVKLKKLPSLNITANMISINDIEILDPDINNDETYPSHVILPVMIYVGQRKRDIL